MKDVWLIELMRLNERGRKPSTYENFGRCMELSGRGNIQKAPCFECRCLLAGSTRAHGRKRCAPQGGGGVLQDIPDNHVENNPYNILFGQGDWTCSVAEFTGTIEGSHDGSQWKVGSTYEQKISKRVLYGGLLDEREIVEEKLFYYLVGGYEAARPDVNLLFHHVYYTRVW